MATARTVKIGSLAPGVNNRLEPTQLATVLPDRSRGTYLYAADNVNLNDKGYVERREGYAIVKPGRAHSIWSDVDGTASFGVIDDVLYQFTEAGATITGAVVRTGMPYLPVSYSLGADGDTYWSNGSVLRRVAGGVDRPAATPPLTFTPGAGITAGVLPAGRYLLAFTPQGADGEGPATPVQQIVLDQPGGISFGIDATTNVYLSATDGDILTYQGTGLANVATYAVGGRRCAVLNTAPMPPGQIVRHFNGSLVVATGNVLLASLPWNYGITDPSRYYIPFPSRITIVQPCVNGIYICADKTYWITSLTSDADLQEQLPYGGIFGTGGVSATDEQVYWQSSRGLIVADKNQTVKNVQEDALEVANAASGASMFRQSDGSTHIVASRVNEQPNTAASSTWMDAEIVRKETEL